MISTSSSMAQILISGGSFAFLLLECILVYVIAKNASISRWMSLTLIGTLISLSGAFVQLVFPWIFARPTAGSMTEYIALVTLMHLAGKLCFLVGLGGSLAEVRNRNQVLSAMLNKPPAVDEIR